MMADTIEQQKTILVICFTDLARDPRVNRQIRFLAGSGKYRVIAAGRADPQVPEVEFIPPFDPPATTRQAASSAPQAANTAQPHEHHRATATRTKRIVEAIKKRTRIRTRIRQAYRYIRREINRIQRYIEFYGPLLQRKYEHFYWKISGTQAYLPNVSSIRANLILANDINTLPLALHIAKIHRAKVVLDAHEYSPRQFEDRFLWRYFFMDYMRYLCATYIPQVDGMMTVGSGIAQQYQQVTGVKSVVVTNATNYVVLNPLLRPETEQCIRLIHHGAANPSRKLESMVEMMDYLDDRFELDMLLIANTPADQEYLAQLKKQAQPNPKIRFLSPIPMQELIQFSHQYDIGIYLLKPVNFNQQHALPNKFFEFIQARLAVAIGPSPEMAHLVQQYDCGIVADDFDPRTMANCLMQLDHVQINYYKQQAHTAARELSAEQNGRKILALVGEVLEEA
jgi:glycosyltransferase involved in cell wall biosynthesis